MTPDFLLQLAIGIGAACGVYAAIKSDLTRAILLAEMALHDTTKAHERISEHLERHHINVINAGG